MNAAKGGQHQTQHNSVSFIHVWLLYDVFIREKTFLNCENSHKKANTIVTALILLSYNSYFTFLIRYFTTFLCTKQNTEMSKTFSSYVSIFHLSHLFNSRFLDWGTKRLNTSAKCCTNSRQHREKTSRETRRTRPISDEWLKWMMVQRRRRRRAEENHEWTTTL